MSCGWSIERCNTWQPDARDDDIEDKLRHPRGCASPSVPVTHSNSVGRLEKTEAANVLALVNALSERGCADPVPTAVPFGSGLLVVSGARRYVNRAVGVTLDELGPDDVTTIVRHYTDAGLPPAVQLSSWAPPSTVAALGAAGFVPAWCRSMRAVDPRAPLSTDRAAPADSRWIEIVESR